MADLFSKFQTAAEQLLSEQIVGDELYRSVVFDAVTHPLGQLGVRSVDDEAAVLMDQHEDYVYLRYRADLEQEILARVENLCSPQSPVSQIAILGGPKALAKPLADIEREHTNRSPIVHWSSDGDVWLSRKAARSPIARRVRRVASGDAPPKDEELFWARVREGRRYYELSRAELEAFMRRFHRQKPRATYSLIGATAVVFGLQLLWGGAESPPVAYHMGSMVAESVRAGEYWRVLSYAWLHAGWLHFLVNMWVLALLGGLIERLIGPVRLVILYVAGALGGGLAVLWASEGQTVGASGAIWAMLAATFVLSVRSEGLMPRRVMLGLRKAAVLNLMLNLGISFLPQVSMAGHLGGGAAAVLLLGSGVLTSGLRGDAKRLEVRRSSRSLLVALALSMAAYVAAPLRAFAAGQPWQLNSPPSYVLTEVGDTGWKVELPESIAKVYEASGPADTRSHLFGGPLRTPAMIEIVAQKTNLLDQSAQRAALEELDAQPEPLEEGFVPLAEPRIERIGSRSVLTRSYSDKMKSWVIRRAHFFEEDRHVRVETMHRAEFSESYRDLLERVVATLDFD